jgi:hypothetical protein
MMFHHHVRVAIEGETATACPTGTRAQQRGNDMRCTTSSHSRVNTSVWNHVPRMRFISD